MEKDPDLKYVRYRWIEMVAKKTGFTLQIEKLTLEMFPVLSVKECLDQRVIILCKEQYCFENRFRLLFLRYRIR